MDRREAELRARLIGLSEPALRRVLRLSGQAGNTRAVEIVTAELARRGVESHASTVHAIAAARQCQDYWHTVVAFRTARCPACGSSSSEVWPRTPATRAHKFRPRKERPKQVRKSQRDDDSLFEFLWDLLDELSDD